MLSGQYTSIQSIFDRVLRNFEQDEFNPSDVVEHVADALDLIGAHTVYEDKVKSLDIREYRTDLPSDLLYIIQTRKIEDGFFLPMRYTTDSFHLSHHCNTSADITTNQNCQHTYSINKHHIHTSFEEGCIQLAYKAIVLDDNGLPMVPSDTKVQLFLQDYVIERMMYKLYLRGKIDRVKWQDARQERNWGAGAAHNHAMMPSVDQMESIKNIWVRLIKANDWHSSYFRSSGSIEKIRVQPNRKLS